MRIEEDSHVPVYLQIVELIRSRIAAGIYRAGEGLPIPTHTPGNAECTSCPTNQTTSSKPPVSPIG